MDTWVMANRTQVLWRLFYISKTCGIINESQACCERKRKRGRHICTGVPFSLIGYSPPLFNLQLRRYSHGRVHTYIATVSCSLPLVSHCGIETFLFGQEAGTNARNLSARPHSVCSCICMCALCRVWVCLSIFTYRGCICRPLTILACFVSRIF